jgi:hypothetical protein
MGSHLCTVSGARERSVRFGPGEAENDRRMIAVDLEARPGGIVTPPEQSGFNLGVGVQAETLHGSGEPTQSLGTHAVLLQTTEASRAFADCRK